MTHLSLAEIRADLELALSEGRVTLIGDRDTRAASPDFLRRLDDLSPSFRRLALARACVIPWTSQPNELPACFEWELTKAVREAHEDRAAYPDMDALVDELFAEVPEPISEAVLRQIPAMTPTARYFSLIFGLAGAWPGGPKPLLVGSPDAPKWLQSELAYAEHLCSDEYRVWRDRGWAA